MTCPQRFQVVYQFAFLYRGARAKEPHLVSELSATKAKRCAIAIRSYVPSQKWSHIVSHSNIRQIATVLVLAGVGSPAFAEFRYENGSGGSATFYGQFSPAYLSFDDGESTTDEIVDNSNSNSRVGLWLRGVYGDNNLALNVETALGLRQSSALSATNTPKAIDWERTSIRKVDVSWETAGFGTFYVGQGSMATDGVAENDLSGTSLVMYSSVPDTAGGFEFRDSSGAFSGITIGSRFSNLDGGRRGRVRYDTPEFSGFILSAAYGEEILDRDNDNKFADVALKYSADITDFKIQAAVGYSHTDRGRGVKQQRHDWLVECSAYLRVQCYSCSGRPR